MVLTDLAWRKSSYSGGDNECVEVAILPHFLDHDCGDKNIKQRVIMLRDSKKPKGPFLYFTPDEWKSLCLGFRQGRFDGTP